MDTVVLGWDPDQGDRWSPSYADCVRRCREADCLLGRWPVGDWRLAPAGTHVHLMLLGRQRGLVGRGTVRSAPFLSADPMRPGQLIHHVLVEWDTLLPLDRPIPVAALEAAVPELAWRGSYSCALAVSPQGAQQLDLMWATNAESPTRRLTRNALRLLRR
jgi:hypothetical protein